MVGRNRFDDNKVVVYEPTGNIDVYNLLEKVQFTPFMKSRFQKLEAVLRTVNKYEEETKQLSSAILIINLEGLVLQSNLVNIVKGFTSLHFWFTHRSPSEPSLEICLKTWQLLTETLYFHVRRNFRAISDNVGNFVWRVPSAVFSDSRDQCTIIYEHYMGRGQPISRRWTYG